MLFSDRLEARIAECGNPICLGMDPKLSLMPVERRHSQVHTPEDKIRFFYMDILEECEKRNVKPAVVKPNSAYYECVSIEGMRVLHDLIAAYKSAGIPVILDAKRGDIGKSSAAYADAAFRIYEADAVTVSPWMGKDSVGPFLEHPANGGVYALLRTSNKGAADFQDMPVKDSTAFFQVAQKLVEWDNGNLGAVVGATHPEELEKITSFFVAAQHEIPFLIPGVSIPGVPGGQGGDAKTVLQAIANGGGKRHFHVLNSSSGLNFAWQRSGKEAEYAAACVDAMESLAEALH